MTKVKPSMTGLDRPTVGKIIPREKRIIPGLKVDQIKGDGSVEDFLTWIGHFGANDSGHFISKEACIDVADELGAYIAAGSGEVKTEDDKEGLLRHILSVTLSGSFTSEGAADDFCRQVRKYLEVDGSIVKTREAAEEPGSKRRGRKAKR